MAVVEGSGGGVRACSRGHASFERWEVVVAGHTPAVEAAAALGVPDHPRPFNATNPVRSLQQHPGSGYHHVVPTVMFDGAPRLSPAAGRPTYCTMEVEIKYPPKHIVGVHERGSRGWLDPVGGVDSIHEREHPTSGNLEILSLLFFYDEVQFIYLPIVSPITYVFPCSSYSMRRFVDAQQSLQTAMLNNVNSSGSLDWSWYRIHLKLGLGTGYILSWSSSLSRWRCVYVYMCSGDRRTYLVGWGRRQNLWVHDGKNCKFLFGCSAYPSLISFMFRIADEDVCA
ncbi:hypothetical protein CFC21_052244 [Triticum aestivum]|uniref:Uncharacterized protein n=3 Tax=Triticum TaxID=4564 RepID=A0A9R0S991_TRITD|nr:hypothetical protein CFC21_052244 [Triticum aestivum]VAH91091.1 unnamed protein product [Triticum turgidum subsp. durum]